MNTTEVSLLGFKFVTTRHQTTSGKTGIECEFAPTNIITRILFAAVVLAVPASVIIGCVWGLLKLVSAVFG